MTQRVKLIDFAAILSRLAHIYSGRGQNESLPRTAALYAAIVAAALAALIAAWHPPLAHADGGASARGQAVAAAPDQPRPTPLDYAQQILLALSDRDANIWTRYWQARAACDATPAPAAPLDSALLTLTAAICVHIDARLGVNIPAPQALPAENRTVGLLLNQPGAAVGYTLFTGLLNNDVFLIDPLGRVTYSWRLDTPVDHAKLLDNGNLLVAQLNSVSEIDPRGNVAWQDRIGGNHHDFLKMPNGNVLLLVGRRKTREQAIAAGANPAFVDELGIMYGNVVEVRPTGASGGEIVWEWSAWDHIIQDFDPTKPNYGAIAEHPELIDLNFPLEPLSNRGERDSGSWMHANALDYNPALDQIMLSPRHFSELWIIDHSPSTQEARGHSGGNGGMGGDLLYRWGNPRAYDRGTLADQRLFWQHQTHWIPQGSPGAGNILIFNNGWEFRGAERFYSSIDEIAPPADGYRYRRAENAAYPPEKLAWTYAAQPPADFYAPYLSGTQRLPNGNTLIVDGVAGTISQTTQNGEIAWKYVVPINRHTHLRQGEQPPASNTLTFPSLYGDPVSLRANRLYRAYWYPPDHPGLQALDLTPGAYIEDTPDIYDRARATIAAAAAGDFGDPLADSDFDIYLDKDKRRLIYIKQPCAAGDTRHKFFLRITPAHARDLPAHRQEHGFDNIVFSHDRREIQSIREGCVAARRLPRYPIQSISAGQFTDAGSVWQADINLNE